MGSTNLGIFVRGVSVDDNLGLPIYFVQFIPMLFSAVTSSMMTAQLKHSDHRGQGRHREVVTVILTLQKQPEMAAGA